MNIIAKLLLNCLYGRFDMSDYFSATQILNEKEYVPLFAISAEKRPDILDVETIKVKDKIIYIVAIEPNQQVSLLRV